MSFEKSVVSVVAVVVASLCVVGVVAAQNQTQTSPETPKPPTIDWGKCPQLEPSEADRANKSRVLEECLKEHPVPKNLTEESVEKHQKSIAFCALKREKWFTKGGNYRFSKAEAEIKVKKLSKEVENQLLSHHKKCEKESKEMFSQKEKVIEQIQLYQACVS